MGGGKTERRRRQRGQRVERVAPTRPDLRAGPCEVRSRAVLPLASPSSSQTSAPAQGAVSGSSRRRQGICRAQTSRSPGRTAPEGGARSLNSGVDWKHHRSARGTHGALIGQVPPRRSRRPRRLCCRGPSRSRRPSFLGFAAASLPVSSPFMFRGSTSLRQRLGAERDGEGAVALRAAMPGFARSQRVGGSHPPVAQRRQLRLSANGAARMGIEPRSICSRLAGGASRNATWAGLVPVEPCGEVGIGQADVLPGSALASAGPERVGPLGVHDEGPGDPLLVDILRVCLGGQHDLAERPEPAHDRAPAGPSHRSAGGPKSPALSPPALTICRC